MPRSRLVALAGMLCLALFLVPVPPLYALAGGPTSAAGTRPAAIRSAVVPAITEPEPPGVEFTLLKDEVDASGRWQQKFLLLIKPGGTLAETSELVYGNMEHVDELFTEIKKQYPNLRSPAQVPANLNVELSLDPRVAFVPREVQVDANRGAIVYSYYNGARRVVYDSKRASDHKGLTEIVELPGDRPTKTFTILEDFVPREVPAGVRIAYYEFQTSDNLKRVVTEIYGTNSTKAIKDFLRQTRWDPNSWPPELRERTQRLAVPIDESFEDDPFAPLDVVTGNPAAGEPLVVQVASRSEAGIYPLRRQAYGTVYRVVAHDFNLTARQVSKLLYGHEDEYLAIAAQAGFGSLFDLSQSRPEDVRIFGHSFDILVDYEKEQFLARQSLDQQSGKRTTLLLNGTLIEEWELKPGQHGVMRQATLPSGYRKVVYRPQTISTLAGDILYTLVSLGRRGNPLVQQEERGGFVANLVWSTGRSVPRGENEVLDYARAYTVPTGEPNKNEQLLEFATRPGPPSALKALPFYRPWLDNPFAVGGIAVLLALAMLGTFGWIARRV